MTTHYPHDAAIKRVADGLLDRSLPKPEWTHAAHFAATLWLLRHRPDLDLTTALRPVISAYNMATGGVNNDTEGYHETITQASIAAARAFASLYADDVALHAIVDDLMVSSLGKRDWLLQFWTRERLFSVAARHAWIDPDVRVLHAFPHLSA